jgi:hypothetical protein
VLLAEGEGFGVVTESELVLAILALIDLIGEAVELALLRIELLFADERIVLRECEGRSAQAEPSDGHKSDGNQLHRYFFLS